MHEISFHYFPGVTVVSLCAILQIHSSIHSFIDLFIYLILEVAFAHPHIPQKFNSTDRMFVED